MELGIDHNRDRLQENNIVNEVKDSFLDYMRRDDDNLPVLPIFIATIAKENFSVEKVEAIFEASPVRILFEYEDEMAKSISEATTRILDTIPKDSVWGETNVFDSNCKNVFASIAVQNAGYELAKQNPDTAKIIIDKAKCLKFWGKEAADGAKKAGEKAAENAEKAA